MNRLTALVLSMLSLCMVNITARELPDTVNIDIAGAERIFFNNNLQLLAAKYNIKAAEGSIVQAGLWNNPNLTIEQNVYNQYTGKYFDFTSSGNTGIQIQQLLDLAGKRNKQVQIAGINKEAAELNFNELIRTLKFELRTDIYDLYYLRKSKAFYDESIPRLLKAIKSLEGVYSQRSVLLSEMLRLKSLQFTLENERLGITNQIEELENDLRILLNSNEKKNTYYVPEINAPLYESVTLDNLTLDSIISAALEKRGDYKSADAAIRSEETNLKLQESLAVPDVTVGGSWSRQGGYIPNYYALNVSVDLPLFNRNQGNIEVSKNTLESNRKLKEQAGLNIEREVTNAFEKAQKVDLLYKTFDKKFISNTRELVDGMISNYEKRYITIIEFTDFYESYRTSVLQINQLENNRLDAFENLNYRAGTDLIKLN